MPQALVVDRHRFIVVSTRDREGLAIWFNEHNASKLRQDNIWEVRRRLLEIEGVRATYFHHGGEARYLTVYLDAKKTIDEVKDAIRRVLDSLMDTLVVPEPLNTDVKKVKI